MTGPVDPNVTPEMIAATQPVILSPGTPGGIPAAPPSTTPPPVVDEWEPVPEFADEEVLFRKDGTVVWRVDGQRTVLRRPKFKELRMLREEIAALAADSREERVELQERLAVLTKPLEDELAVYAADPDNGDQERIARVREELLAVQQSDEWASIEAELREQRAKSDVTVLAWFRDAILIRLGRPIVAVSDPEDLPGWCVDPQFLRDLLDHWSQVPRRPGVV